MKNIVLTVLGVLLVAGGLFMLRGAAGSQGVLLTLSYLCIGLGCGMFGHGMGELLSRSVVKRNPALQKQIEIEQRDERNTAISNRAKARAYDMMIYVFGALMISFSLMGVELRAILLLVFAYLFVVGWGVYYRCRFEKEM